MRHGEDRSHRTIKTLPDDVTIRLDTTRGLNGCPVRGLDLRSYYHLFEPTGDEDCATPPQAVLETIAKSMIVGKDPLEGQDEEGIPAGYTYFGQFVIHDLTDSRPTPRASDGSSGSVENFRTPRLDLDSLYGNGPSKDPDLYQPSSPNGTGRFLFNLGKVASPSRPGCEGTVLDAADLPRRNMSPSGGCPEGSICVEPIVADHRNDGNLILSQLTVLFLRIHNHVATGLKLNGKTNEESFHLAREFLVKSYRRVVIHDYLERLLCKKVYRHLTSDESSWFGCSSDRDGLPLEFVFGAGRIGHAMVRNSYRINDCEVGQRAALGRILGFSSFSAIPDLPLPADWHVDWRNFFDLSEDRCPQRARRISPFWPEVLQRGNHALFDGSLMLQELDRSGDHRVLCGQSCARSLQRMMEKKSAGEDKLEIDVLSGHDMFPKQTIPPMGRIETRLYFDKLMKAIAESEDFQNHTPLVYYLVQESVLEYEGLRLGNLGSYIFALAIASALANSHVGSQARGANALDHAKVREGVYTMPKLIEILSIDDPSEIEHETLNAIQ